MKVILDDIRPWRHDLAGCLHACAATLLAQQGGSPLDALGAGWQFHYTAGDFRREEYYFPLRPGRSLLAELAPYESLGSRWHDPANADEGWDQVRRKVATGTPVAVAVDNFHLPFRPAYHDVHANHLVIVYGFDDEEQTVRVLDAVPPLFDGDIAQSTLRAARGSTNEGEHDRDMFFADQQIGHRWLEVRGQPGAGRPERAEVLAYLGRNHTAFSAGRAGPDFAGRAGLAAFLDGIERQHAAGEPIADELFIVAGAALATTALHADWLRATAQRLRLPWLTELGRDTERIAHHWTAVRILAALTREGTVDTARLTRRHRDLIAGYDSVFAAIGDAIEGERC